MASNGQLTVRLARPDSGAEWDQFVLDCPGASVYHLAGWRDLIAQTFGRETYYLLAEAAGAIKGVLPLVRLKSVLFGDFLVSLPYVTYGGVLAQDSDAAARLLEAGVDLARRLGVEHMEIRHTKDGVTLPMRTDKVAMQLALCGDSEERWRALGAKRRAQIKRPLREGAESVIGGVELITDFYPVFATKYRDLGVPVYPASWFEGVLKTFSNRCRVFSIRIGGEPVAASIVIGFDGKLEVPWAASLRWADCFGVNMYLYWTMLKYAEEQSYQVFDFGRSTIGSGTWRFKKQWGAEPVQLFWHYWLRDGGELPQLTTANPKYQAATAMWRRLPVWLANRIGPRLVKNLP